MGWIRIRNSQKFVAGSGINYSGSTTLIKITKSNKESTGNIFHVLVNLFIFCLFYTPWIRIRVEADEDLGSAL